ncbi:hypothetical protein GGR57DRAFT_505948 [Xylariaceae sp. FL1272]|nr:hypothetical protein GGR57DRAFT_505948 [Xylariaceae sp. FL1272]
MSRANNNIELGARQQPQPVGYDQWASWIATDADSETFVFRKFDKLAALNLLYLQSEILEIEAELERLNEKIMKNPRCDVATINAMREFETLVGQCGEEEPRKEATERMVLIKRLRSAMKEYQEALLLQNRMAELQAPSNRVLRALKQMFWQGGNPVIEGKASGYLEHKKDLVALKSAGKDPLSNYLRGAIARSDVLEGKGNAEPRIARFQESSVTRLVNIATTVVAAIFLIGPILALYFVQSSAAKLALIAVFTAGFALSVTAITNARRAEIFAGTATYAAVLVVFVSSVNSRMDKPGLP